MGTLNKILLHHRQKRPAIYHQMIDLRLPHRYNKHNLSWIQKKIHFFANSCKYISLKLELWYCHSWCNGNIFIRIRNILILKDFIPSQYTRFEVQLFKNRKNMGQKVIFQSNSIERLQVVNLLDIISIIFNRIRNNTLYLLGIQKNEYFPYQK